MPLLSFFLMLSQVWQCSISNYWGKGKGIAHSFSQWRVFWGHLLFTTCCLVFESTFSTFVKLSNSPYRPGQLEKVVCKIMKSVSSSSSSHRSMYHRVKPGFGNLKSKGNDFILLTILQIFSIPDPQNHTQNTFTLQRKPIIQRKEKKNILSADQ